MKLKIVSGGQTGADRAGLDAAIESGLLSGGWCPNGRLAEDGRIDKKYSLTETESSDYSVRTKLNVEESDGTLIFINGELEGGTFNTVEHAKTKNKPYLIYDFKSDSCLNNVIVWICQNKIKVLNIAGPRASKQPDIYKMVKSTLMEIFENMKHIK